MESLLTLSGSKYSDEFLNHIVIGDKIWILHITPETKGPSMKFSFYIKSKTNLEPQKSYENHYVSDDELKDGVCKQLNHLSEIDYTGGTDKLETTIQVFKF